MHIAPHLAAAPADFNSYDYISDNFNSDSDDCSSDGDNDADFDDVCSVGDFDSDGGG